MNTKSQKHTLVLGASLNPSRYSNICIRDLVEYDFPVTAIGLRQGEVAGIIIHTDLPEMEDIHTITLYLGTKNQLPYYDYILKIKPERLIFNPGTWNDELATKASEAGIRVESKCTLMMISGGYY